MALKAGSETDYSGSMAEAMEQALAEMWTARTGSALPTTGQGDRRLLFSAIARGILSHLKANPDAFKISVTVVQDTDPATHGLLLSNNPGVVQVTYNSTYGSHIPASQAEVKQTSPPIVSEGDNTLTEIEVDDVP